MCTRVFGTPAMQLLSDGLGIFKISIFRYKGPKRAVHIRSERTAHYLRHIHHLGKIGPLFCALVREEAIFDICAVSWCANEGFTSMFT